MAEPRNRHPAARNEDMPRLLPASAPLDSEAASMTRSIAARPRLLFGGFQPFCFGLLEQFSPQGLPELSKLTLQAARHCRICRVSLGQSLARFARKQLQRKECHMRHKPDEPAA